jgi:histidinol-phosphate aminotransferase
MAGYTPGEQPRDDVFIKLNTNESPYPPSPRVFEAVKATLTGDRLRKYPDPVGTAFRQAAGKALGIDPDGILIGNGSDDVLTIITRAFVPEGGLIVSPSPSYLLYRTLAEIQGARFQTVPFTPEWGLPDPWPVPEANLTFLANPNSPSGTVVEMEDLERLTDTLEGPLVLDEAYVDFAERNGLSLIGRKNTIVTRSFSKSYALAGIRFGFAVADPAVVRELNKVKDSYNCDVLSLAAATAAIEDQEYFQATRARILATRERLTLSLRALGFAVCSSQTNFVWCRQEQWDLKAIYEAFKRKHILVRYMHYTDYGEGLRISVGSDDEIDQLLTALTDILRDGRG